MNENFSQKALRKEDMTLEEWITQATKKLKSVGIESARLDAELLLSHTIREHRTYIHAHGDKHLDAQYQSIADARLDLRLERAPMAYIIGHKEFYGRRFKTTPAALIPRPESEIIIEQLSIIIPKLLEESGRTIYLADVGTGTGCLGITAKLEWPDVNVTLTDIDPHALSLAKENAKLFGANVTYLKNDLLRGYGLPLDIIVANLPYVDTAWEVSPETHLEPRLALYADNHGLELIYKLLEQSLLWLSKGGYVLIESDHRQLDSIATYAKSLGLTHVTTEGLITVFRLS